MIEKKLFNNGLADEDDEIIEYEIAATLSGIHIHSTNKLKSRKLKLPYEKIRDNPCIKNVENLLVEVNKHICNETREKEKIRLVYSFERDRGFDRLSAILHSNQLLNDSK